MANKIGWGLGELNNSINWGLGAVNNSISWGNIQGKSWFGDTIETIPSELSKRYADRVLDDGGVVESELCLNSDYDNNNWVYYFRVVDDGGVVESLECVNNIN